MKRGVQYLRRLAIFDNLAKIHDSDIFTHVLNDGEIMVDENVNKTQPRLSLPYQVLKETDALGVPLVGRLKIA